jgi:DNA-binding MarR family transcriptional regulator
MTGDHVDRVLEQWARERPDLDVSAMAVIGRISRVERLVQARLAEVFDANGLESWEFDVLATLRRSGAPYRLTAGQLLEQTMVTSGAMTNRIDRLEARRLVRRSKSPTDARLVLVELTANGRRTVDRVVEHHAVNESGIVAALSPRQRTAIIDALRTIEAALGTGNDAVRPARRSR